MRSFILVLGALGLAACSPTVPDSAQGVGFDNYETYLQQQAAREAQLSQRNAPQTVRPPASIDPLNQPGIITPVESSSQQTASAAVAAIRTPTTSNGALARGDSVPAGIQNTSPNVQAQDNPNISDEQDFQAVSARQSIESDAQRRQQQSSQYQVVAPQALPRRPSGISPTPIEFALETRHPVGQKTYGRNPFGGTKKAQEACAAYRSDELAQDAFLKSGGPKKDKLGLDPDGDGYACAWNPAKYRTAVRG